MVLKDVSVGDPHSQSHNEERRSINELWNNVRALWEQPKGGSKVKEIKSGYAPFFADRDRYYAPITYWWADYWNTSGNWSKTLEEPDVLGPMLINVGNGPGAALDGDWVRQVKIARARGCKIMGYVSTLYGKRSKDAILEDLRKHVEFYQVDGVFLDEMTNGVDENAQYVDQYLDLFYAIKETYGQEFWVVGNPGTSTAPGVLDCADTIMVYESDADYYLNPTWDLHPSYYADWPRTKFWHVIHTVKNYEQALKVLEAASTKYRPAFLYLTDLRFNNNTENPYAAPPSKWLRDLQISWARHQNYDTGWTYFSEDIPGRQSGDWIRARSSESFVSVQAYLTPREWPEQFTIPLPDRFQMIETRTMCGIDGGAPRGPLVSVSDNVIIWGAPTGGALRFDASNFRP